jgi:pantetheine-phosphate adenylyltransferase
MVPTDPGTAVYTGSFDPITLGHLNIVERASRLFRRLIIGVGTHAGKQAMFTPSERVVLIEKVTRRFANVEVRQFGGLSVDFVRQCGSRVMVRGVRPLTDIAAEFTMMMANKHLDPDIETVFLMADEEYAHVSSSLIKQITPLATDEKMASFFPREIIPDLRRKTSETENV